MGKRFYLVTTEHLCNRIWFKDDDDFKAGMNYVATVAPVIGVTVLAFILMSNHVHFVLYCAEDVALRFINEFKRRFSMYCSKKYGANEFLRRNSVDIREIDDTDESLEKAIAYVQMNSVAARIVTHPSQYQWGTGEVFFNQNPRQGKPASQFSKRKLSAILHSYEEFPEGYTINDSGYVNPASYVNVEFVEKLFRTTTRMSYFLNNSSKAKKALENDAMPSFKDQSIIAAIPDLCVSLFRKKCMEELSLSQKSELVKQLRYRFSADVSQLSRVLNTSYEIMTGMLDEY